MHAAARSPRPAPPLFLPVGDQALSVQLSDRIDPDANARVIALAADLKADPCPGIVETVPTYRALLVRYDPTVIRGAALEEILAERLRRPAPEAAEGRLWRVPVHYGGPAALDLEALAEMKGMDPAALAALHAAPEYRVAMIGFAPGFAYLDGLDARLHAPRLPVPRQSVPAGAIGIGGQQASVNSVASPSGWRYIGATPMRLFDPDRDPAVLLTAGDRIRFEPVDFAMFLRLGARAEAGSPLITPEVEA
ncbi:5-oxoprolinase subunit PxpB [Falsirhodobacter algicola]|uniref:5-oxoprolinase subunit PxpB n=1 Tax=Falsirhodobacter algicola TaxID=2692330 RepID=A0A8J8MW07_9RHOB|nr:5-oxoprolinase subunit PxpB [Falsirhodobacter algicola]QUS37313.1 5-oxoprolinase subunit PxpB [Falsirhodobacter algicola]